MQNQIHFIDYLKIIWKKRVACVLIVSSITLGVVIYSLTLPNIYLAEASFVPTTSAGGGGSGGGSSGVSTALSLLTPGASGNTNRFILYLRSRALRERVVKALNLTPIWVPQSTSGMILSDEERLVAAADRLSGMVNIKNDLVFLDKITVRVENSDPNLATAIARQYLVELQNFISDNALTSAKRYRFFLEAQLAKNKEEVLEMAKYLANFYRTHDISEAKGKMNVPIAVNTQNGVRALKNFEEFKKRFDVLQREEKPLTEDVKYVQDVPHQIYMKYLLMQQQTLEQNSAFLEQSYQMARVEEAKEEPSFQILEEPVLPRYPIKPQKRSMAKGALGCSILVAICYALFSEFKGTIRRRIFARSVGKKDHLGETGNYGTEEVLGEI